MQDELVQTTDVCEVLCWWHVQCACKGCAKDIMAAGALFPMCRSEVERTITPRF